MTNQQTQNGNGAIYRALGDILAEVGSVAKTQTNKEQRYQFRGIDDVYNVLQPCMKKYGVFCIPRVLHRTQTDRTSRGGTPMLHVVLQMVFRFVAAADGSSITVGPIIGEATDTGDKATNKAMSAAQKYALIQMFMLATGEPVDTENYSPEIAPPARRPAPARTSAADFLTPEEGDNGSRRIAAGAPAEAKQAFGKAAQELADRDANGWKLTNADKLQLACRALELSGAKTLAEATAWMSQHATLGVEVNGETGEVQGVQLMRQETER